MRGIGGPLLSTGDLLTEVGEEESSGPLDLIKLFQVPQCLQHHGMGIPYLEKLFQALAGSWTALTLESTDTNVR
ncbi:hypothetical protein V6N13_143379 [Hibiscus sabdariffa]|uniref:Uncharacterized protein n=1 Tax=Hibiscus sabdariffa TaxID=183260 RepID=A0ABR2FH36_9ROSI